MGPSRGSYETILPKESFIHIGDFDEVQALANYLHTLDKVRMASSRVIVNFNDVPEPITLFLFSRALKSSKGTLTI